MPATFALALTVGSFSAVFAHYFRESIHFVLEHVGGSTSSVTAARTAPRPLVFALVTSGLLLASFLSRVASRWRNERLGLGPIADAARGVGNGPSVRGTLLRGSATWVSMVSLASLGREAAILETGGSVGAWLAHKFRRPPADLASVGIAAAFAAAYHAPISGFLYVQEHVVHRPLRRTRWCALVGAVIGYLVASKAFGSSTIFAKGKNPLGAGAFAHAAVGLLPAFVATHLFFALRKRVAPSLAARPESVRIWTRSAAFAIVGGLTIALIPLASGNGMEAIRYGVTDATLGVALALLIGKTIATTASIGSGAPGGVFSPSMAIAAGAALLSYTLLQRYGVVLPGSSWDGMLAAMAIGIAVGTQTPLVGIVAVSELAGDIRLLPICALSVGAVKLIQLGIGLVHTMRSPESGETGLLDA